MACYSLLQFYHFFLNLLMQPEGESEGGAKGQGEGEGEGCQLLDASGWGIEYASDAILGLGC
jgi:hypothetical protein